MFLENVSGHLSLGAGQVIRDLHGLGYRVTAGLFSSEEVGASHRRERLFILGNREDDARCMVEPEGRDAAVDPGGANGELGNGRSCGCNDAERGQSSDFAAERHSAMAHAAGGKKRRREQVAAIGRGEPGPTQLGAAVADGGGGREQGAAENISLGHDAVTVGQRDELPRYAPARDLDLNATAKALSAAADFKAAGEVAVDAARVARQVYRDWETVASVDPTRMPAVESKLLGVADGLAGRADRLRLVGNGVDPLCAAYAFITLSCCLQEGE